MESSIVADLLRLSHDCLPTVRAFPRLCSTTLFTETVRIMARPEVTRPSDLYKWSVAKFCQETKSSPASSSYHISWSKAAPVRWRLIWLLSAQPWGYSSCCLLGVAWLCLIFLTWTMEYSVSLTSAPSCGIPCPRLSLLAHERAGKSAERLFHRAGRAEGKNRAVTPTATTAISLSRWSGPDLTGRLWRFLAISNFYFVVAQKSETFRNILLIHFVEYLW